MDFIIETLRTYPALTLFLTVGLGFLLGKLKFGRFSLGSVTAVLIMGVVIGQIGVTLSAQLKSVFFMLFLFSIGYSVGPQFFRSLKGMGLKQVIFALLMSSTCFAATLGLALLFGYSPGETVGLFSGSQTCSSLLAVGTDAINNQGGSEAYKTRELNIMPVCYAVTYVFGTLGTVIILGNFGPKLLGGTEKVKRLTAELEAQVDDMGWRNDPVNINALQKVAFRCFRVDSPFFAGGRSVKTTEAFFRSMGRVVYVERLRNRDGEIETAHPATIIRQGDTVVLFGRYNYIIDEGATIGPEVNDEELLMFPVERIPVLATRRGVCGKTVEELRSEPYMRGVVIEEMSDSDGSVEVTDGTVIRKGITLTIVGRKEFVRRAVKELGYMELPTTRTDIMFVGLAIFIGALFGCIPIIIDGIPISFGISGGSLIGGLFFGWLRQKRPSIGYIPDSALWLMNHLGLNVFIAVIGLDAATSFVEGLHTVGFTLLLAGAVGTMIPLFAGLWLGHKVFRFNPAITLGCCAGTRTCTAALGAVQDSLGSTLPAMGYTVTYAVSNIMLVIWGLLTVILAS